MPPKKFQKRKAGWGKAPTGKFSNRTPRFQLAQSRAVTPVIPDRLFTKLKTTVFLSTSDSVASDDLVLQANSAFDPFQAEGSSQPQGFDQWAGFYFQYRVWSARIRVSSVPIAGTGTEEISAVAIIANNSVTAITGATAAMSAPFTKWRLFERKDDISKSVMSSLDRKLTMNMSTQKMLGLSSVGVEGNPNLSAATTANPSTTWFFHVFNGTDTGSNVCRFTHIIELEQEVEFFDRLPIADAEVQRALVRKAYSERKTNKKTHQAHADKKEVFLPEKRASSEKASIVAGVPKKWSEESDDDESLFAEFQAWKKKLDKGDAKSV
jgi:hypothetical protein